MFLVGLGLSSGIFHVHMGLDEYLGCGERGVGSGQGWEV